MSQIKVFLHIYSFVIFFIEKMQRNSEIREHKALDMLNTWVSEKSEGRLTGIISSDSTGGINAAIIPVSTP